MNVLTYEQLKQQLESREREVMALTNENVELKYALSPTSIPDDAIDAFSNAVTFDSDSDGYHSWVSVSNEDEVIRAVMAVICKVETPATDTALAAVEAKAIEKAAKKIFGCGYSFELLMRHAKALREGRV